MIAIADIIAHLKSDLPASSFRFVSGAADFLAMQDQLPATPALFVLPSANRASQNTVMTGAIRQRIDQQFTFVIALNNAGPKGEKQLDRIQELEAAIKDVMVGWTPPNGQLFFTYVAGRLLGMDLAKQSIFWGSDFTAPTWERRDTTNG